MDAIHNIDTTSNRSGVTAAVANAARVAQKREGVSETVSKNADLTKTAAVPEDVTQIEKAIQRIENFKLSNQDTRFRFHVDDDSGKVRIHLVNSKTGEVIDEIPSKKLLEFANSLQDFIGFAIEKKA